MKIGTVVRIVGTVVVAGGELITILTDKGPTAELVAEEVAKQMAKK